MVIALSDTQASPETRERLRVRCVVRAEPQSEERLNNELPVATAHVRGEKDCAEGYVTLDLFTCWRASDCVFS